MTNVSTWSTTAGSNNGAPPAGWPENMLPGKVNDCAREMMAALSKWYKDSSSSLLTAGTQPAYTLTTNSVHTALSQIPLLTFRIHATNVGGACTLNVDSLGAKPLRKNASLIDFAASELVANQTMTVAYNSNTDDFECIGPVTDSAFEAGTVMLFQQTAAPTGWTKDTVTHNNKALRMVTGTASSGGTTAFTSVMASRTLVQANLPVMNLGFSLSTADHAHNFSGTTSSGGSHNHSYERPDNSTTRSSSGSTSIWQSDTSGFNTSTDGAHTHTYSGTTTGSVSGLGVSGTISLGGSATALDFNVQYVDVISATKS